MLTNELLQLYDKLEVLEGKNSPTFLEEESISEELSESDNSIPYMAPTIILSELKGVANIAMTEYLKERYGQNSPKRLSLYKKKGLSRN